MECASQTVKKVFLELGGKSATIMLDDADLGESLAGIGMLCTHAGQGCAITTRLLLPRSRYEEGVGPRQGGFEKLAYGDPTNPAHLMGPLVSRTQRDRVLGYIEKGRQEGARVVTGGGVPKHLAEGLLRRADALRRRRPRLDARAGGGLRAGAGGHPLRGRRRRGAHRQRLDLRPLGRGQRAPARSARSRWRAASAPGRSASTAPCGSPSTRPSAATARAASVARTASPGFEEYLETKVIALPRQERAAMRQRRERMAAAEPPRLAGALPLLGHMVEMRARPGRAHRARARRVRRGRRVPHARQARRAAQRRGGAGGVLPRAGRAARARRSPTAS